MSLIDGDKLYDILEDDLSWIMGYDGDAYLTTGYCIRNAIDKLAQECELESKDKSLNVTLPCKFEDELFYFDEGVETEIKEAIEEDGEFNPKDWIKSMVVWQFVITGKDNRIEIDSPTHWGGSRDFVLADQMGKTVFLSEEDAINKLREIKEEVKNPCSTYAEIQEEKKIKDALFDTGYKAAIDDMQVNLIRNSRTETIDGRMRLIVTEDTIEKICREMRKRCEQHVL